MNELKVTARDGAEIKVLYYSAQKVNAPLLLEMHGGGFIYGSAADDGIMCGELAKTNCVNVASVDYRLAPKHVYPTATNDCEDVLKALIANVGLDFDRERIAVLGSSAGANIAAGLSFRFKNFDGLKGQILIYPFLNALENNRKYVFSSFTRAELKSFNDKYFPDKNLRGEFAASTLCGSKEDFYRLPPALIYTAGIDTLRTDGAEYARLLDKAGVRCRLINYPAARHGYFENVPNGGINKWWWLSGKGRRAQEDCYFKTTAGISNFLKEIF